MRTAMSFLKTWSAQNAKLVIKQMQIQFVWKQKRMEMEEPSS